ncbi:MAG: hypothetical protein IPH12_03750 [Saprospirales bacterium]|nr:hypothetical protein [Saprospirales bacterium]
MKTARFFPVLLAITAFFIHCKHQQQYTGDNLPAEALYFGNGGGFTGAETAYALLENGQLFKWADKASGAEVLTGFSRKAARKLFESAQKQEVLKTEFMHPGNMYSFIELHQNGREFHRIAWGDRDHPVDPKIKELHEALMQLTN